MRCLNPFCRNRAPQDFEYCGDCYEAGWHDTGDDSADCAREDAADAERDDRLTGDRE